MNRDSQRRVVYTYRPHLRFTSYSPLPAGELLPGNRPSSRLGRLLVGPHLTIRLHELLARLARTRAVSCAVMGLRLGAVVELLRLAACWTGHVALSFSSERLPDLRRV